MDCVNDGKIIGIMNETKKTSFYLLVTCTLVMFGIAAYLLASGGSSHGIVWGGRYGEKLEGTINGYGVLMIAVVMLFYALSWIWQNRPKGFSISTGEAENVIISHACPEQVKELLSSGYWGTEIRVYVRNNANGHTLQIVRTGREKVRVRLSDKKKHVFRLTAFSHGQTDEVVDDFFRSSNLLKEKKYVWKEE